jgi:CO/xanthine dehydrogenase Mo-binding subunit
MIASDQTGISMDNIEVVWGDTDLVPKGGGTMGSRSLQLGGTAVFVAAGELVEQARKHAARLLEANEEDVVFDKAAAAFAETVKAKQLAKPTKTEYKKIKGKMTPVVTQGYGEAEATAEALALAKKDPLYAEFQTANVFGSALEKALGVRG